MWCARSIQEEDDRIRPVGKSLFEYYLTRMYRLQTVFRMELRDIICCYSLYALFLQSHLPTNANDRIKTVHEI